MTTNTSPAILAFATLVAVAAFGCDSGTDSEGALEADAEAEILAEIAPEHLYPLSLDELDGEPPVATELAAPETEAVPVVEHYLYPGQPGWIPTCILGTQICVTNPNGAHADYLANLSIAGVAAYSTTCNVWYFDPPGAGGFVSNAAWSPGPLAFSTSCPYGF